MIYLVRRYVDALPHDEYGVDDNTGIYKAASWLGSNQIEHYSWRRSQMRLWHRGCFIHPTPQSQNHFQPASSMPKSAAR